MRRFVGLLSSCLVLRAVWPVVMIAGVAPCAIQGTITAGGVPLPGVVITLTDSDSRVAETTSSAADGSFRLTPSSPGAYQLAADLTAFAALERDVTVDTTCQKPLE